MDIVLFATPLPDMFGRQVLRCAECRLVQFRRKRPFCARCKQLLFADELTFQSGDTPPAPGLLVAEKPKTCSEIVCANIKRIRQEIGLSQSGLAKLLGSPRTWISKIETGKTDPVVTSLERVSGALGISIADLLSDKALVQPGAIEREIWNDPFLAAIAPFVKSICRRDRLLLMANSLW